MILPTPKEGWQEAREEISLQAHGSQIGHNDGRDVSGKSKPMSMYVASYQQVNGFRSKRVTIG